MFNYYFDSDRDGHADVEIPSRYERPVYILRFYPKTYTFSADLKFNIC